ncbi:hypothetical protein GGD38_005052 [Chitinophagaceae bacterium OAS944]|nr:hypothetical protein [Chitinophagaceae bacterium OAS944]
MMGLSFIKNTFLLWIFLPDILWNVDCTNISYVNTRDRRQGQ